MAPRRLFAKIYHKIEMYFNIVISGVIGIKRTVASFSIIVVLLSTIAGMCYGGN